jgi:TonB family protein
MKLQKALKISLGLHLVACFILIFVNAYEKPKKITLEASLVFKNSKKSKDLLPKKTMEKKIIVKEIAKKADKKEEKIAKKNNFLDELEVLSKSYEEDLAKKPTFNPEDELVNSTYFDEIYTLIKNSFFIPPHLNTPDALKLKSLLRITINAQGDTLKVVLEKSSGDDYFDQIVLSGTKKVTNFGPPPINLQESLSSVGILIELCPKNCEN